MSNQPQKNPTTSAQRRYYWEFGISIVLYMAVLFASRALWRDVTGPMEIFVALLPMIPIGLVFAAVLRWVLAADELQRQMLVESLAIAAGITALISVTYGFLEGSPLPRPSAWWTYLVVMISWLIASFFVRKRYE